MGFRIKGFVSSIQYILSVVISKSTERKHNGQLEIKTKFQEYSRKGNSKIKNSGELTDCEVQFSSSWQFITRGLFAFSHSAGKTFDTEEVRMKTLLKLFFKQLLISLIFSSVYALLSEQTLRII